MELDVPPTLTTGDEITLPIPNRNYLDSVQNVLVSAIAPASLQLLGPVQQPGSIAASSSANAVLTLRAATATDAARLRVTALARQGSDAIEKPIQIHPDGRLHESTFTAVAADGRLLAFPVASDALPGGLRAELKFYPSILSRILESIEALLQRPHGCAEQTISSAYPSLLLLRAIRQTGVKRPSLETRAKKYLDDGYQRLLGYQSEAGGFTYWGHGAPDIALTAYALTFLREAKEFSPIDEASIRSAERWLGKQQAESPSVSALRFRALAPAGSAADLDSRLGTLAREAARYEHPYAIATFALAALEAGKPELARTAIEQLLSQAQDDHGAAYWHFRANTPFYGFGRSGQQETT
ncbi:MAG: hypothetical protein NTY38_13225, partial [Acidobacteria bacterium]|nr:hypothetical protein [Acidobacteriota bacterium]